MTLVVGKPGELQREMAREIIARLPQRNYDILHHIARFLAEIAARSAENKYVRAICQLSCGYSARSLLIRYAYHYLNNPNTCIHSCHVPMIDSLPCTHTTWDTD